MVDSSGGGALGGYKAPNDGHEVVWVRLWEPTRRVHFVHEEGDVVCAEFLDEEM